MRFKMIVRNSRVLDSSVMVSYPIRSSRYSEGQVTTQRNLSSVERYCLLPVSSYRFRLIVRLDSSCTGRVWGKKFSLSFFLIRLCGPTLFTNWWRIGWIGQFRRFFVSQNVNPHVRARSRSQEGLPRLYWTKETHHKAPLAPEQLCPLGATSFASNVTRAGTLFSDTRTLSGSLLWLLITIRLSITQRLYVHVPCSASKVFKL